MRTSIKQLIAPVFWKMHQQIKNHEYTHYWLPGGRGGTKSSFISVEIILGLMRTPGVHAIALRKVGATLRESVFAQLEWAINMLGVAKYWDIKVSPLSMTYRPYGNKVIFRGLDDVEKLKSVKIPKGYLAYGWFEELSEFSSMDEINNALQSIMRGGSDFWEFYSYNPPESINNWVNSECVIPKANRVVQKSCYLDVPREWIGEPFFLEAEDMKERHHDKWKWQYMGVPIGTGGEIFRNVKALSMTDEMISRFDRIHAGLDWGWSIDPLAYVEFQFDKARKTIYIYHEKYGLHINNDMIGRYILGRHLPCPVICDSADLRSINAIREMGVRAMPCVKGPNSVRTTTQYLTDDIDTIYIDPKRCPHTYKEFTGYALEPDKHGGFKADYPDKNNHCIDAVRYGTGERHIKAKRSNIY